MALYDYLGIDNTNRPITPDMVMVRALASSGNWNALAIFCNVVRGTRSR